MSEDPELEAALTYPHFQSKTLFPSNHPEWALLCWDDCPPGKHINVKEKLMKEVKRYKAQKSIDDDTGLLVKVYIMLLLGKFNRFFTSLLSFDFNQMKCHFAQCLQTRRAVRFSLV